MSGVLNRNAKELLAKAGKFTPDETAALEKANGTLENLLDTVLNANNGTRHIVEGMGREAHVNGNNWLKRAPDNLDRDTYYKQYSGPGNFVSLRDQILHSPQFLNELKAVYKNGPLSEDMKKTLQEAGQILGQNLFEKLGVSPQASQAPERRADAAGRNNNPQQPAAPASQPSPAAFTGGGNAVLGKNATEVLAKAGRFDPSEVTAIQDANTKIARLLEAAWMDENGNGINNQARDLVARMGQEANANANNWLKRAPEGIDQYAYYQQYSSPGYFVSMRDQLRDSPKFWNELKKTYDKDMADGTLSERMKTTLQEAGQVLGRDLVETLKSPEPGKKRDRAQNNVIDSHAQDTPPDIFAGRINPNDPQTQNYAVIQSFNGPLQEILKTKRLEDLRLDDFSDAFKANFDRMRREGRAGPLLQAVSNYISENVTNQPAADIMRTLSENLGLRQAHNNQHQYGAPPQRQAVAAGQLVETFIAGINNTVPHQHHAHQASGMQPGLIGIFQNAVHGITQQNPYQPEMNAALNVISGIANLMTSKI